MSDRNSATESWLTAPRNMNTCYFVPFYEYDHYSINIPYRTTEPSIRDRGFSVEGGIERMDSSRSYIIRNQGAWVRFAMLHTSSESDPNEARRGLSWYCSTPVPGAGMTINFRPCSSLFLRNCTSDRCLDSETVTPTVLLTRVLDRFRALTAPGITRMYHSHLLEHQKISQYNDYDRRLYQHLATTTRRNPILSVSF